MAASPQRPGHAVYISSRRRRTIIPSHRRRLPPSRSTPQKNRIGVRSSPHASSPAAPTTDFTLSSAQSQLRTPGNQVHRGASPTVSDSDDQSEPEEEDAALTRMQDRLSAMIVECNTALSSQAQPVTAMDSVILEEERQYAQSRACLSALNSPDQQSRSRLSPSPSSLGRTPQLYGSPPPPRERGSSRGLPSRIPKPSTPVKVAAPQQPPSAPTFAFHLGPSSNSHGPGPAMMTSPPRRSHHHQRMASSMTTTPSVDGDRTPRALSPADLPTRSPVRSPRPTTQTRAPWR